jgi:predicted TIM-barrel fold metal-dependent hydrolase
VDRRLRHKGNTVEDRLIVVSSDSHAGIPKELWTEYLDPRFHDLLPSLHEDNVIYPTAVALLGARKESLAPFEEHREIHRTGWDGLYDPVLRMADMDREGVAAEMVFHGDSRLGDLFHNGTNRAYPLEAWEAGAKAWNRWAADTFGFAPDRFLLTAAVGPCTDIDAAVAEIHWIADHGFTATYGPHYLTHPGLPPLFDAYWEPYWRACVERGIAVVVHAGYGTEHGQVFQVIQDVYDAAAEAAGSTETAKMLEHADAVHPESAEFFTWFVNRNLSSRRPLWQLTLGGVFDRHPDLRLMLTEIRQDWIPETLDYLDGVFEERRSELPTTRKPSEHWHTNCLAGASFMHKIEASDDQRHRVGVDNILFGRDYPHFESTWPHTREWLQDLFYGLPDDEVRKMLGENAVRFFDLDRDRLVEIAKRIGPKLEDVNGTDPDRIRPELIDNFQARGGYLKPAEGDEKIDELRAMVEKDLDLVGRS